MSTATDHQIPVSSRFRNFPNELLSEIFTFFCQSSLSPPRSLEASSLEEDWQFSATGKFVGTNTGTTRPPPQNILTAVCSHWRQVALRTPGLWQDLTICFRHGQSPNHTCFTWEWLARSGSLPLALDISTGCLPDPYDIMNSEAQDVLPLITHHANRWSELQLRLPFEFYYPILALDPSRIRLPFLRTIDFSFTDNRTRETFPDNSTFDCLLAASQLQEVTLLGHHGKDLQPPILDRLLLPKTQLTSLTIQNLSSTSLWGPHFASEILLSCPVLQEANLYILSGTQRALPPPPLSRSGEGITTLPHLKELTLIMDCLTGLNYVLANLSLPNLTFLSLSHTPDLSRHYYGFPFEADSPLLSTSQSNNPNASIDPRVLFPITFLRLFNNSRFALRTLKLVNIDILTSRVLEEFLLGVNDTLEQLEVFYCQALDLKSLVEGFECGYRKEHSRYGYEDEEDEGDARTRKSYLDNKTDLPRVTVVLPRLTKLSIGASFAGISKGEGEGDADGVVNWTLQRMIERPMESQAREATDGDGMVEETETGQVALLKDVYFEFNTTALTEVKKVFLEDAMETLRLNISLDLVDEVWVYEDGEEWYDDDDDDDEDEDDEEESDDDDN